MSSTPIRLARPIYTYSGEVREIALAEPRGRDFLRFGEPVVYGQNPDGTVFAAENEEVIRKYIDAALPENVDPAHIEQLCLEDAMKIKAAILDFFRAARDRQSAQSSTSSSSTPA